MKHLLERRGQVDLLEEPAVGSGLPRGLPTVDRGGVRVPERDGAPAFPQHAECRIVEIPVADHEPVVAAVRQEVVGHEAVGVRPVALLLETVLVRRLFLWCARAVHKLPQSRHEGVPAGSAVGEASSVRDAIEVEGHRVVPGSAKGCSHVRG